MKNQWIVLPTLAAAISLATTGVHAETAPGPNYRAEPCCSLCPAAHDPGQYNTDYKRNFTTLVEGGEKDWLFRTREDLRTEFGTSEEGWRMLRELHDAFKRRGVELVVVYQPTRGLVNRSKLAAEQKAGFDYDLALKNYRKALGRFEEIGFRVPDLSPLTDEKEPHAFYFRGDQHWTPYGAERTAKIVAETVRHMPEFSGIQRKEFVTRKQGLMGKRGTLHNVAGQICGTSYAYEYSDQFFTEPKGESASGDLFGNAELPRITLVGTSHSGENYNFSGFLEQYIGADILNVAFPGGGLEGAMLEYLGSEEFQTHPPKILIWEFSPLYDLAQEKIHRQFLALLEDNACDGRPALLASKATLHPGGGSKEVLVNGAGKLVDASNSRHQLDIRFSDPSVKTLEGFIWYMTGRREKVKFEKPNTADTDGRFAFHLRDDGDWGDLDFLALEIQTPEGLTQPVEVEARLCQRNDHRPPAKLTADAGR